MNIKIQATPRSLLRRLTGVQILTTGSFAPPQVVTNDDLQRTHGCDAEWISTRTGINERRLAPPEQATSDLAYEAAIRCIERADTPRDEIDLLVVATSSPDKPLPSTACILQDRLGLASAPAMDVQAACAGFMYAMVTAMQFVANGASRSALAVGADCVSRLANPQDQRMFPLFGDGAGAVLIGPGKSDQGLLAYTLGSDGTGYDVLSLPMGGSQMAFSADGLADDMQYMRMDGRAMFKWGVKTLRQTIIDVVQKAGLTIDDVDLFILHQTNTRIIQAAAEGLGIGLDRFLVNLDRYGNTSSGAIPLALDEAMAQERIKPGNHIVLSGFGAGLAWGTALMRW